MAQRIFPKAQVLSRFWINVLVLLHSALQNTFLPIHIVVCVASSTQFGLPASGASLRAQQTHSQLLIVVVSVLAVGILLQTAGCQVSICVDLMGEEGALEALEADRLRIGRSVMVDFCLHASAAGVLLARQASVLINIMIIGVKVAEGTDLNAASLEQPVTL